MIRRATPGDAGDIARVHVRTWRRAYADIIDAEELAALSTEEFAERWERLLRDPRTLVWVCDVEDAVRGFASVRDGELTTLYVDPAAQGAGVGAALLDTATEAGARFLCVLEANEHGRRFYERRGWTPAGPGEQMRGLETVRYEHPGS